MKFRIGIVGTRQRDTIEDYSKVKEAFKTVLYKCNEVISKNPRIELQIVSGGCSRGGDRFAKLLSKEFNIPIKIYYPDWTKYENMAGLIRNTLIVENCDYLIACVSMERKGGTEDTIRKMIKKGGMKCVCIVE
jgi:hypothetical protein